MLETLLFFALGFAVAGLIALAMLPAIWARALRLTKRRIEVDVPLSMAEVRAGRDEERAAAALELRRVERALEAERERRHRLMADVGRERLATRRALADAATKEERLRYAEDDIAALRSVILKGEEDVSLSRAEIAAAKVALAARENSGEVLRREINAVRAEFDTVRTELAAARMKIQNLENDLMAARRENERVIAAGVERDGRILLQSIELGKKETQIDSLESQLAAATDRATTMARHVAEKSAEIVALEASQMEFERRMAASAAQMLKVDSTLAERSAKLAIATARETELQKEIERLRAEARITAGDLARGIDVMRDDRSHIEAQLEAARADRALLVKEIGILKKEAAEGWKLVEADNQALRIELAKLAAEIAEDAAARRSVIVPPPVEMNVANDDPGQRKGRRKRTDERADAPQG